MSDKTRTGWVYVLVNESIADQVKVGFTSGRPEDRAKELHTSGVPTPYKVATAFLFTDKAKQIEQRAHLMLKDCRVSPDREFFRRDAANAAIIIRLAAKELGQAPVAIEPVLVDRESMAVALEEAEAWKRKEEEARKRKEEEARERLQKQREEAQRQQRKAEEEERRELLRKQEIEREERRFLEEEKRESRDIKLGCLAPFLILIIIFLFEKCTGSTFFFGGKR